MKIKRAPKRSPTTPAIAAFILSLCEAQQDELPALLLPITSKGWNWPRTDLQHWINPLNRFDTILEEVVRDYDLSSMEHCQLNAFTPRTKELVGAILAFEKVLLENSTNRKIFASFDRLNDLLHTTDLDILLATLRLGLRPAQQFSTSGQNGSVSFGISEKRLLSLAQGWGTRDYGLEMVDHAAETLEIPPELDEFEWQFYKKTVGGFPQRRSSLTESGSEKKDKDGMDIEESAAGGASASASTSAAPAPAPAPATPATHGTPAPKPRAAFAPGGLLATPIPATPGNPSSSAAAPTEGLTTVLLGNVRLSPKSAIDLYVDAVEEYNVPESDRLSLLQKIRIAKSLGSAQERRTMLVVRLLAIAILAHTSGESNIQSKLFLYEPELIPQLAELVHPDRSVPIDVQAASFYALEALAKFKTKTSEVASALNASVSHGILMYVLRRTVSDLDGDSPISTPEFIDSLFNILTYFQTNGHIGSMIVGAGVTGILVNFVKNQRRDRLGVVTRAITFLDGLMYGYSSAFNLFITLGGLQVFVDRVRDEVEVCIEAHSSVASTSQDTLDTPTGLLSHEQAALLKALLRALQRLMQTAGTTEGLRNLIDTSLLASVKSIISNRPIMGPQLFALAVNITASFVHNEPTCLTTIQEAKVPDALYDAIEESVPSSFDVLQAIPNAIGALCLNAAGLAQFNSRPIIEKYFAIFTSERHVRALHERQNSPATMIGSCIDELIRHHPTLKDKILDSVMIVLKEIRQSAREFVPESAEGYTLQTVSLPGPSQDSQAMEVSIDDQPVSAAAPAVAEGEAASTEGPASKSDEVKDNLVMISLDVVCRFLEGLFQHQQHCKDFIKLDPFSIILDIFALPCTPAAVLTSPAFMSVSALFRIMGELKPTEVIQAVLRKVEASLVDTRSIWSPFSTESRLQTLLAPTPDTLADANGSFRELSTLLTYVALLLDLFNALLYASTKIATLALTLLSAPGEAQTIEELGAVHRFCTWENIHLKKTVVPASSVSPVPPSSVPDGGAVASTPAASTSTETSAPATSTAAEAPSKPFPVSSSAKAVQELVSQIPQNISALLQAITKMFLNRRSGEATHRKATTEVAASIAKVMTQCLQWVDSPVLSDNLAISTLMINLTSSLICEERSGPSTFHTILLVEFDKAAGLELFLSIYTRFHDSADKLIGDSSEPAITSIAPGLPVVHAFGGLKLALDLLVRLTSSSDFLEAQQTALLVSREQDRTRPDFFEPDVFLIKLRAAVLPVVAKTWESSWLRKSPQNVVRAVVSTLINILRAEGETASEVQSASSMVPPASITEAPSFSAAFAGLAAAAGLQGTGRRLPLGAGVGAGAGGVVAGGPFLVDEGRITQLIEMGFPRAAARTALTRYQNNVHEATEYLLRRPDIVGEAREAEAAEAEAPAPPPPQPEVPAADAPEDPAPMDVAVGDAEIVVVVEGEPAGVPAPSVEASDAPADAPSALSPSAPGDGDVEMNDAIPRQDDASAPTTTQAEAEAAALAKERKETLDKEREQIKPGFLSKALVLAEDCPEVVFDIKGAFGLLQSTTNKAASLAPLLEDLAEADKRDASELAVATRLRVIALMAADSVYKETIEKSREEAMAALLRYHRRFAEMPSDRKMAQPPKWLSATMLVADSMFSLAEVPRTVDVLPEANQSDSVELVEQGPKWSSERSSFFDLAMEILLSGTADRDLFMSCVRLLLVLTRDHALATKFVQLDGLRVLFAALAKPEAEGCYPFAVMLLRHVMEDQATLQPMMVREIEAWFALPRQKVADITGFLRGTSSVAFRNVTVFLQAAKEACMLVRPDTGSHFHVALKHQPSSSASTEVDHTIKSPFAGDGTTVSHEEAPAVEDGGISTKVISSSSTVSPTTETAIHFLMSQALDSSKAVLAPLPPAEAEVAVTMADAGSLSSPVTAVSVDPPAVASTTTEVGAKPSEEPHSAEFMQMCFSLSCLAELLASYSTCKSSFLAFSTRRSGKEATARELTAPRSRSSFLYFLLNDLIPLGTVVPAGDAEGKRRGTLSMWATLVIVSLCSDPEAGSSKDSAAEITAVRKGVLDAISRAFKEATSSNEPTDVRYGRLVPLSDLCYRLLTTRPFPSVTKPNDDTSMQFAKLMLEKNFAVILTNALADVDLNFPSVNNLVNTILRPLEQLTKVVNKVGRSKHASAAPAHRLGDMSSSDDSMSEEEADIESEEEEAPDLYRNSALGMYEGELEPGNQDDAYMSGDSAEEYDEEDDELMEDLDDGLGGSDLSDVSDDDGPEFIDEDDIEIEDMIEGDSDGEDDSGDDDDSDIDGSEDDSDGGSLDDELELNDGEDVADILEADLQDGFDDGGEGDEGEWIEDDGDEDDQGDGLALAADGYDDPDGGADLDTDGESYSEDEFFMTGELEFDPQFTEQLSTANRRQAAAAPFGWDAFGVDPGSRRQSRLLDAVMMDGSGGLGGRSRVSQAAQTPAHPLLVDAPAADASNGAPTSRRHRRGHGQGTAAYNEWAQSIEHVMGAGAVEVLQDLLGPRNYQQIAGNDQVRLQIGTGPDGGIAMIIGAPPPGGPAQNDGLAGHGPLATGAGGRHAGLISGHRSSRTTSERPSTSQFLPVMTVQRWQEEGRIAQGGVLVADRIARLTNHLVNVLHPAARAAAKAAEAERLSKAAAKKEEEAAAAAKAEEDAAKERDRQAAVAAELPAAPSALMDLEDSAQRPASETQAVVASSTPAAAAPADDTPMLDDMAEVLRLANSLAAGLAVPSPTPATPSGGATPVAAAGPILAAASRTEDHEQPNNGEDGDGDDGDDDGDDEDEGGDPESAEASSSSAARVTITIDGQEIDITDTGVDPTFLEALPDEMRQEVLNQHFRESRSAAPPPAVPSSISSEFLDALPPDLRAEVLRAELAEQRREQAAARAAAAPARAAAGPVDIDPATFFASLDPELRQAVLMEQEDLSGLPPNIAAEATALRGTSGRDAAAGLRGHRLAPVAPQAGGAGSASPPKKAVAPREAIQLLDKSGLATLVRLLFFPQPLRKNSLQKVLVNLCENSRTRTELINLLLTILQDGTRDVSAVDKSFSQMSLRASKSFTGKDTPRRKVGLDTPGGSLPHFPGESVPNLIAQRCLEALMYLVASNDQSSLFFLTEQENVVGLSRRHLKKGKGKEKALPTTSFPIITLLGLLDRPALVKTQSMMDSLTQLLSAITKSLTVLQKKSSDVDGSGAIPSAPQGVSAPAVAMALETEGATAPAPSAAITAGTETVAPEPAGEAAASIETVKDAKDAKDGVKEILTTDTIVKNPPQISPSILRLVANVLDAGECSSKTFQQTLILIQNLSYLPDARDTMLEELKLRAESLSSQLLPDLDELLHVINTGDDVRSVTLAKFSPASSLQAKFLRILKTIDHSPPKSTVPDIAGPGGIKKLSEEEEKVRAIYDSFSFGSLWDRLGLCLTAVEEKPELAYIGNVLLPLIEAVMVVSKFIGRRPPKDPLSPGDASMSPSAAHEPDPASIEGVFLKFTDDHRRTINQLVRSNPGLMSGSFAVLAKNSSILDFDTKRNFFFSRLHDRSLRQRTHYGTLQVNVRRANVFEDSFDVLKRRTGDEIKNGKLNVKFYNEEGVDAGGVTREWFSVLARQMFNPGYALFQPQAADSLTYQPNKSSSVNDEHLNYFKFIGRVIGKALHDQRVLEAYFSRAMYKHMLGKPVDHRDLESIDPEYHKSLVWMLENDIDGILDLTFSVERDDFGVNEIVDLVPNGRNVAVTNENKAEYVRLIADQRLSIEIKDQMEAMLKGLYEIVPKELLQIFSEKELELLISGLPEIDVDEWRANTDLHNYSSTHPIIGYFWRAVRSFSMEERAKLLQFVSGSSRVPLEGFAHLQGMSGVTKFSITNAGETGGLPTAHTCFNQLDLSSGYSSYEDLRRALLTAITEGSGEFGFA